MKNREILYFGCESFLKKVKIILLFLFFFSFSLFSFAQLTQKHNNILQIFLEAEELFEKKQYANSRIRFREFINQSKELNDLYLVKAYYFEGLSALELYHNDAINLLEDFNSNYPENIYKFDVYFKLGRFYYHKKEYATCIKWLSKLNKFQLKENQKEEFIFKLAYSYFQENKIKEAKSLFYEIKDGASSYAMPSLYYYSHIAYDEKNYQSALDGFEKLVNDVSFAQIAKNYIIQIYYRLGKYQDVINYGPKYLDSVTGSTLLEMNHLIGDAYFILGKYDEAIPYLENYNFNIKTKRQDDYELAYSYMKSNFFEKAILLFDKITRTKDSLAQIVYYHIGECYMKQNVFENARSAFEQASVLSYNAKIQEDALYQYAVLSYKIGLNPYDEAIEALELYLEKYPNSDRKNEVYDYLINVYTSTSNYDLALKSLEKIKDKNFRLKVAYQIIAFNQGITYFQKAQYELAIKSFEKVHTFSINEQVSDEADYWTAESYHQQKKYDKAISSFKKYIQSPGTSTLQRRKDAIYSLAYCYLSKGNFVDAIENFRFYLQQDELTDITQKADVLVRLGDCYYASKQNELAIKYYQECLDLDFKNQDQALFYLAKTYGYKSEMDLKIKNLLDLINNFQKSRFMILAIYEVGLSYRFKNEEDKAKKYFEQLIKDYPQSPLVKEAEIEIADVYFKTKNYELSEKTYKKILNENSNNKSICNKAVKGIVEIYKQQHTPEKVEDLIKLYSCANLSVDEQEEIYYNSAIEPYLDSSYAESIPELEKYIKKFVNGKYTIEIKSYLANSYFHTKQEEKAIQLYEDILSNSLNDFSELSAVRCSKYYYSKNNYQEAVKKYILVEKISSKPDVLYHAKLGAMRCYTLMEKWQEALDYSKKILFYTQLPTSIRVEAEFAKGKSAFQLGVFENAQPSLEWVKSNTTMAFASESSYLLASIYFQIKDFSKCDTEIKSLMKLKPSYDFWIAKGLMLQAKCYVQKKDYFQAEYTVKSVVDHYPNKDDGILSEANHLWDEIMQIKNKGKTVNEVSSPVIEIKENEKK
ncbi:MAG: tetratricopeptide repeat protein [Flavobacteriia bacterium]|nr:tetratricopeptide repeat protein [Flavobacteriia bacterium]